MGHEIGYDIFMRAGYVAHYYNKNVEIHVAKKYIFSKVKIILNQIFIHPFINTQKYRCGTATSVFEDNNAAFNWIIQQSFCWSNTDYVQVEVDTGPEDEVGWKPVMTPVLGFSFKHPVKAVMVAGYFMIRHIYA